MCPSTRMRRSLVARSLSRAADRRVVVRRAEHEERQREATACVGLGDGVDIVLGVQPRAHDEVFARCDADALEHTGLLAQVERRDAVGDHGGLRVELVAVHVGHRLAVGHERGGALSGDACRALEEHAAGRAPLAPQPFLAVGVQHDRTVAEAVERTERRVGDVDREHHIVIRGPCRERRDQAVAERVPLLARDGRQQYTAHAEVVASAVGLAAPAVHRDAMTVRRPARVTTW